jgi:hypothetical protein
MHAMEELMKANIQRIERLKNGYQADEVEEEVDTGQGGGN